MIEQSAINTPRGSMANLGLLMVRYFELRFSKTDICFKPHGTIKAGLAIKALPVTLQPQVLFSLIKGESL